MERSVYRPTATLFPLVLSVLISGVFAALAVSFLPSRFETMRLTSIALVGLAALVLVGYYVRSRRKSIIFDAKEGLTIPGIGRTEWKDVAGAEFKASVLPYTSSWGELWDSIWVSNVDIVGESLLLTPLMLILQIPLLILFFVVAPLAVLLSPWSSKLTIRLVDGRSLCFRDIERGADLVSSIEGVRQGSVEPVAR